MRRKNLYTLYVDFEKTEYTKMVVKFCAVLQMKNLQHSCNTIGIVIKYFIYKRIFIVQFDKMVRWIALERGLHKPRRKGERR